MEGRDDHQTPQAAGRLRLRFRTANRPLAAEPKLYGGKTFDQWRVTARTYLNYDTRVKAFAALEAFAGNGKSDEAAAAIIEALKVDQSPSL